ncbi:MAG: GNAT family N-acetyltransferase, partial [Methylocella sp.]
KEDITRVRTSVLENHMSVAQMAVIGITPDRIAAEMQAGDLGCWVAEHDGRVIAFAMADRRDGNIFALFVSPKHERQGFGSALLARCESWLKALGYATAKLNTGRGTRAYDFYLKRGWTLTGEKAGHFGEDNVLCKRL